MQQVILLLRTGPAAMVNVKNEDVAFEDVDENGVELGSVAKELWSM